jgi:hypothetical protein
MAGSDGFGSKFYRMSGTSSTALGGVTKIGGPKIEGEEIDVTDMDSPNGRMEFLPGLVDEGEVELELNYIAAQASILYGLFRTTGTYKVVNSDSSNWTFTGFIKSMENETPHDDKITANSTFKVSGKSTYATN